MKNILLPFTFSLALAAVSCGGDSQKPGGDSAAKTGDTATAATTVPLPPELEKLVARFAGNENWPLTTDSLYIENVPAHDSLSAEEVKMLIAGKPKHVLLDGLEWDMRNFSLIDSLKKHKAYAQYCESLDIGMTKEAGARILEKKQLDPQTLLLVWGMFNSSYEACPYSQEKSVYFSLVHDGAVKECFLLGRSSSAADAPVYMHEEIYGQLGKDGKFTLEGELVSNDSGEEDDEMLEKSSYSGQITNGSLGPIAGKKEKPVKNKR